MIGIRSPVRMTHPRGRPYGWAGALLWAPLWYGQSVTLSTCNVQRAAFNARRNRNELVTTKTELHAMAPAASIGFNCQPVKG